VQLTWMDAKIGDWVVTPRYGKPVEIQALGTTRCASCRSWRTFSTTRRQERIAGELARTRAKQLQPPVLE